MMPANSGFHNENNFFKNYLKRSFTSPLLNRKSLNNVGLKYAHMSWVGPGSGRCGVGILA